MVTNKAYQPFVFVLFLVSYSVFGQVSLDYYIPTQENYNNSIPTPKNILGYEIGEWHVSHDKLVKYMEEIAEASDRISIEHFGFSLEKRPLVLLTITSPENHARIEEIKRKHRQLTNPSTSGQLDLKDMPAVIYMGFSIHGNEPSGSNASLALAYYLAAAESDSLKNILDNIIILLDPSFNPDGLNRFASWVNSRRSITEVSDPQNIEQNEPWPGGRTNHYWFDLNRDWLPAQFPVSQARLVKFHEWKPNVLTDHHEMGTNSTFFFQPGIPSRNNPLTPALNFELTAKMGEYHAKALDKIGSLYYTKESFDDYYYGKGSTYPDIQGAVGILFEQASSRSHAQESIHGVLRFPFAIRNQFTTALSTIHAVNDMRMDFLEYQREFYIDASKEAENDKDKAYVFGSSNDPARAYKLAELINRHDIQIYKLKKPVKANNITFDNNSGYIVPLHQPQYKLIKALFETRTSFTDSLFYDISTWTLPFAFNLNYSPLAGNFNETLLGEKFAPNLPEGKFIETEGKPYAYLINWSDYYAPKVLYKLQKSGIKAKVATAPFNSSGKKFDRGTIIIPSEGQEVANEKLTEQLRKLSNENAVRITAVNKGLDYASYSLGSPTFEPLSTPEVAILIGEGISSSEAGEVWHLLDQRFNIPATLLDVGEMSRSDLSRYNTIIIVSGRYSFSDKDNEKLKSWMMNGGTLIAQRTALNYLSNMSLGNIILKKNIDKDSLSQRSYADLEKYRGAQVTGGAIFKVKADLTHPLLYGYDQPELYIFRNHNVFLEPSKNPYANPLVYTSSPLASGYISKENLDLLRNTSAAGVSSYGRGKIVAFTDNLNFRAFWYGTNKMFMNAIFFAPIIERGAGR